MAPHPEMSLNHNPILLCDFAKGVDAGKAMAKKHGFDTDRSFVPDTMWHVMERRRNGDAIVALIGDDRGWAHNWEYFVVVCWSPVHLEEELGYTPALL